jgi:phage baseplate assembly protein W
MSRRDYAFPFRIDPVSRQAARTNYAAHVDQMIRQILLTSPGERADLPEFGCGLRRLIFEPHSDALDATTNLIVTQALDKWLAGQIQVQKITVNGGSTDPAQFTVQIDYLLIETQQQDSTIVAVL